MSKITKVITAILVLSILAVMVVGCTNDSKQQYTVTFNTNGGNTIAAKTVDEGATVQIVEPVKEGSEFKGWYSDSALSEKVTWPLTVEKNITLYAKWQSPEESTKIDLNEDWYDAESGYDITNDNDTLTFSPKAGTTWAALKIDLDEDLKYYDTLIMNYESENLEKFLIKIEGGGVTAIEEWVILDEATGTFKWELSAANLPDGANGQATLLLWINPETDDAEESLTVSDISLVKIVAENAVANNVIRFKSNGGAIVNPIYGAAGSDITEPANPTKSQYDFVQWCSDKELNTTYDFPETMPEESIVLYAKWEFSINLEQSTKVNLNEDWVDVDSAYNITKDNGAVNLDPGEDPAWKLLYTPLTQNYKDYSIIKLVVTSENTNRILLKVEGGGVTASESWINLVQDGSEQTIQWILNANNMPDGNSGDAKLILWLGPDEATADKSLSIKNCELFRNITADAEEQNVIRFETNGGTGIAPIFADEGATITQPENPTKPSFQFENWYSDKDLNNVYSFENTMPENSIVLYAKWNLLTFNEATKKDYTTGWVDNDEGKHTITNVVEGVEITTGAESCWAFVKQDITEDLSNYTKISITLTATSNMPIIFKLQGDGLTAIETTINATANVQITYDWYVTSANMSDGTNANAMFIAFINGPTGDAGEQIVINSIYMYELEVN